MGRAEAHKVRAQVKDARAMYYQTNPTEVWRERHLALLREAEGPRFTRRLQRREAREHEFSKRDRRRTMRLLRRVIALWRVTSISFFGA
jgi:hypothetical protein